MIKTKSPDESAAGLDIIKTLIKIPVSKQVLDETDIMNTVYDYREMCKSDEIISLFKNWTKVISENTNAEDMTNREKTPENRIHDVGNDALEETTIYVRALKVDITRINSVRIFADFKRVINGKPEITLANRSLRIKCVTEEEKQKLTAITHLAGHKVEFTEPYSKINRTGLQKYSNRGIIFEVEEEITDDEIQSTLGIKAERVIKKKSGQTIRTNRVILHFNDEIPKFVHLGWKRYRVSTYVPEPVRCYNCQKFGHKAINCRSKTKCPICSGNHLYNECVAMENKEERRTVCPNCRGEHPAYHKDCIIYQEARSIKTIQVSKQISYAEAVKTFRTSTNHDSRAPNRAHPEPINKTSAEVMEIENHDDNTTADHHPPNEENTNPKVLNKGNNHNNCVNIETLVMFVKSISVLLTGDNTNQELTVKFHEMVEDFVR